MTNEIREGDIWTCGSCSASNIAHGMHWGHQVCAKCITPHYETGNPRKLRPDGFFDSTTRQKIVANIARNGRYIPTF